VQNVHTGNYASGGRGVARGPGGTVAAGAHGTVSNAYTGQEVSGGRGIVYNPNTGQGVSVGGVHGDMGGVGRVGDDVYATHDGKLYRKTGEGWQQQAGGNWNPATPPDGIKRDSAARSGEDARSGAYRKSCGGMNRGGGRRRQRRLSATGRKCAKA